MAPDTHPSAEDSVSMVSHYYAIRSVECKRMDRCWPMETVVDQSLNYCQREMDLDRQTLIVPVIVRSSRHLIHVRLPMVLSSLLAAAVVVVVGFQMVEQLSLVLCRAMVCVTTDNCKINWRFSVLVQSNATNNLP